MAVTPRRLSLTRDQFASFLQDFEQIKQFENLFATVDTMANVTVDDISIAAGNANAAANEANDSIQSLLDSLDRGPPAASQEQIAALQEQITTLQQLPPALDALAVQAIINASSSPVIKTADFTVASGELWIINDKSGSTCTVTLPTASVYAGRTLNFQNYQDQSLVSASSDVIPQGGGSAGSAILTNVAGNWATLVSNGTNWVITQAASFNCLLY
jgi:hypothetical protein